MINDFLKTKLNAIVWISIGLVVVLSYEACSPMKTSSLLNEKTSANDICSIPATPASLLKIQKTQKISFLFEEQKTRLETSLTSKAQSSLLNQLISVEINLKCSPAPGSLSEQVLLQNVSSPKNLSQQVFLFKVPSALTNAEMAAAAQADLCITGVTWPREIRSSETPLPVTNDASTHHQTYLVKNDYAHAYDHIVKKSNGFKNVKIGFVDSGASCNHEDLRDNLVSQCGFDAIDNATPEDNDGHGSHVMGLVGATTNNGKGILGIAGNTAQLHAIRVINVGSGRSIDTANGIQYAIDNQLDVINVSLGSTQRMYDVESKVQQAVAAGIFVVISAGNDGKELHPGTAELITSPAVIGKNLDGAITVGSVNADTNTMSHFSNYGDYVEIAAIGALNHSTSAQSAGLLSTSKDGMYKKGMGTSQAAPMVTGAAALLIQFFKQNNVAYTVAQIENIIKNSVDTKANLPVAGHRILNFAKLTRNAYSFAGLELCPATNPAP